MAIDIKKARLFAVVILIILGGVTTWLLYSYQCCLQNPPKMLVPTAATDNDWNAVFPREFLLSHPEPTLSALTDDGHPNEDDRKFEIKGSHVSSVPQKYNWRGPKAKFFSERHIAKGPRKLMSLNTVDIRKADVVTNNVEPGITHKLSRSKRHGLKTEKPEEIAVPKSNKVKKDTHLDITAQIPHDSGSVSNKLLVDQLSGLFGKVLEKMKKDDTTNESEEETEEESPVEAEEKHKISNSKLVVKSSLECDEWDHEKSICYYDRNIGDTITFQLKYENLHKFHIAQVHWRQEYHIQYSTHMEAVEISADDSVWNIVVGSNGRELRLSPITETDFDFNRFTAVVTFMDPHLPNRHHVVRKISFSLRPVPIDMGYVYPGEKIILNVRSFISLPLQSLNFHWYMERDGEKGTLPSNMKVSTSGSSVAISEFRKEQEGIIVCAIYKTPNIFLTKKRFLIKEIKKSVLIHGLDGHNAERESPHYHNGHILRRVVNEVEQSPENEMSTVRKDDESFHPEAQSNHLSDLNPHDTDQQLGVPDFEESPNSIANPKGFQTNEIYDGSSPSQGNPGQLPWSSHGASSENGEGRPTANNEFWNNPVESLSNSGQVGKNEVFSAVPSVPQVQENINSFEKQSHDNQKHGPESEQIGQQFLQQQHQQPPSMHHFLRTGSEYVNTGSTVVHGEAHKIPPPNLRPRKAPVETAEEKIAKMIGGCISDRECSEYATCFQPEVSKRGVCQCHPDYRGNGIFCWEIIIPGKPTIFKTDDFAG